TCGIARNPAGGGTAVEDLRGLVEVDRDRDEVRLGRDPVCAPRRHEEVDQRVLASFVDHPETAGPEAGQLALADERGQNRADRGVAGIPALTQHLRPSLGGQRMTRGDHSPQGWHWPSLGGTLPERNRPAFAAGMCWLWTRCLSPAANRHRQD